MRNRLTVLAAACAALVTCAVVGTVVATGAASPEASAVERPPGRTGLEHFAVAQGPGADAVSEADRAWLNRVNTRGGFDVSTARVAQRDAAHKLFVTAEAGKLCLLPKEADGSGSMNCGAPSALATGHEPLVSVNVRGPGLWRVAGMVPDGVTEVVVELRESTERRVTVRNNTFSAALAGTPRAVSWVAPDGIGERVAFSALEG